MSKITYGVCGGHGLESLGAIGYHNESLQVRKIKDSLVRQLQIANESVIDATIDIGTQSDVLYKKVQKLNNANVDYAIDIHLDAFSNNSANGSTIYVYNKSDAELMKKAELILAHLNAIGFKNRGIKETKNLYFLNKTKMPSMLIECYFCTNIEDCERTIPERIAESIARGLLNKNVWNNYQNFKNYTYLNTVVNSSAQNNTEQSSAVQCSAVQYAKSKDNIYNKEYYATTLLNIRSGANTKFSVLGTLSVGEIFKCYGYYTKEEDGTIWLYGKSKSGVVGFVSRNYLK